MQKKLTKACKLDPKAVAYEFYGLLIDCDSYCLLDVICGLVLQWLGNKT